jgi:hypothetical protein
MSHNPHAPGTQEHANFEAAKIASDLGGAPTHTTAETSKPAEAEKSELHKTIKANFNNLVDVVETKFHFRKVVDEVTKEETKRPTVVIPLPSPSVEGLVNIIEKGGKGLELLLEAASAVVQDVARDYINNNESVTTDNFPFEILGWEAIANMPKAERRGGGISSEVWEEFKKDYINVMPSVTGKSKEKVELAAKVLHTKFAAVKTNKPVIKLLQEQLAIYINHSPNVEQFVDCVDFLDKKAKTLLETDSSNLLEAL